MTPRLWSRRRLLALGGSGMMLATLGGCGGGGDGGAPAPAPDPGPGSGGGVPGAGAPGTAVSAAQRVAALDDVAAAVAALLPAGDDSPRFDSAELVRRLQTHPAFRRVGVSDRMQNVWATFTDGVALVVPNNLAPLPGAAPAAAPPGPTARALSARRRALADGGDDLPALLVQPQFRQINTLGEVPLSASLAAAHLCADFVGPDTLPALRRMALARGFKMPQGTDDAVLTEGTDSGLAALRPVDGDGVFFITGCAAEVGDEDQRTTVICTDTPPTAATLAALASAPSAGALVMAVTLRAVEGVWVPVKRLAIRPEFVEIEGWSFPAESIGILNLTGGSVLPEWQSVLNTAGLRNLFGWGQLVPWQRMLAFADDLLQMELGTNNLDGRAVRLDTPPRVRAYGVGETIGFLEGRGLANDAGGRSQAAYFPSQLPAWLASVLIPTIDYVLIKEDEGLLELIGQFGQASTGGLRFQPSLPPAVRYGGALGRFDEPLLSRAADPLMNGGYDTIDIGSRGDIIQGLIRPGDLARGGLVQVVNGERWSNAVPITHWEIPVQVVSTITGGLTLTVTVTLHLRGDMRGYRLQPDGERNNGAVFLPLGTSADSGAAFVATGEISRTEGRETTTVTWRGSGSIGSEPGDLRVQASGVLDWLARRFWASLTVSALMTHDQRTVVTRLNPETGVRTTVSDVTEARPVGVGVFGAPPAFGAPPGGLSFDFNERWELLPGELTLPAETIQLLGERTLTTMVRWGGVMPDFPPEADGIGGI